MVTAVADSTMAQNTTKETVAVVYQRMLPYHRDRFAAFSARLATSNIDCVAIQVAAMDSSYGQLTDEIPFTGEQLANERLITLFPAIDYLQLDPRDVAGAVCQCLQSLSPEYVFTPSPAFAEGAGALHYKIRAGGKLYLMDDAWAATDQRGWLVKAVKRLFYGYMDGGFLPAALHGEYFATLNIPLERQRYAVDVVGPVQSGSVVTPTEIADKPFILFVGRLIARKGLTTVLRAMAAIAAVDLQLVVIGDGPEALTLRQESIALGVESRVHWLGRRDNNVARQWMSRALALVVPSDYEQWGLVVNEAWMAGTVVLGSSTVGALQAALPDDMGWMKLPPADCNAWQRAILVLLSLSADERRYFVNAGYALADEYSLQRHVDSALSLMDLPARSRPPAMVGWLALVWQGKVAVW